MHMRGVPPLCWLLLHMDEGSYQIQAGRVDGVEGGGSIEDALQQAFDHSYAVRAARMRSRLDQLAETTKRVSTQPCTMDCAFRWTCKSIADEHTSTTAHPCICSCRAAFATMAVIVAPSKL